MNCRIINDPEAGKVLIPGCWGVALNWSQPKMTDRQIIKNFCHCKPEERTSLKVTRKEYEEALITIKVYKAENGIN